MNLTHEQLSAASATDPKLVIVACPGAGKTTTLISRIDRMVDAGTDPEEIAMITFTRAGAEVFTSRLSYDLGYAGTLHSFMLKLLRIHGRPLGFTSKLTVIDENQTKALLDETASGLRYTGTKEELKKALSVYWPENRWDRTKAQLVALAYHRQLVRSQVIDFDSVLVMGLALLKHLKEVESNGTRIRHLLIDEVQDSGELDHEIYRRLPVESVTMVGDPWQSLFAFRGGKPEMMPAEKDGFTVHRLTLNHRSTPEIVAIASKLTGEPMVAANPSGPAPEVHGFATLGQESMWIGQDILGKNAPDCAVLLRTNKLVSQYADALVACGVQVARHVPVTTPADWAKAKLAVAFLADPENDWLAARWLTAIGEDGQAALDEAGGEAMSVNRLKIGAKPVSIVYLASSLESMGISSQSIHLIGSFAGKAGVDGLTTLLDAVAEFEDETRQIGEGVYVGTYHKAKGREWDTVYLPAFEQEIIPARRDKLEELRVAYVGITRAKRRVVFTGADRRVDEFKGPYQTTWSEFLEKMGVAPVS